MPLSLKNLLLDERTLAVSFPGGDLTVTYRPSGLTPAVEERLRNAQDNVRSGNTSVGDVLVSFLEATLVSWDLFDDEEDKPLPIAREVLRGLPLNFLGDIVAAIVEDMSANPTRRERSVGGQQQAAPSESLQSGTR